ncbi:ACP S-malonyltransferase [Hungatella hathewayi]|uniref:ACP S-malonyltransferase n=1 Tax=Hungatella hathewayi TaxID=154046 RepID=UPI003569D846
MNKFAFLFPGQGTQFIQMGKYFYEQYIIARQTFEEASEVTGQNVAQLCFNGTFSQINQFANMQIAIVTIETAIFRAYMEDYGIPPHFLVGHSIGEYAALVCSGAIEFSDCMKILMKRGDLVNKVLNEHEGRMTIMENTTEEKLRDIINSAGLTDKVSIACYNSYSQYAVSGNNDAMEVLENEVVTKNVIMTPLLQSPPMHSQLMKTIYEEFRKFLNEFHFHNFQYPVISNLTGKPLTNERKIAEVLSEHLVRPVQFAKSIEYILNFGVDSIIEMSPKILLTLFVNDIAPDVNTFCFGLEKDRERLHILFHEDPNYVKDMPNFLGDCLCLLASTPNNNPNNNNQRVVDIYNNLKREYLNTNQDRFNRSDAYYIQTLKLIVEALRTKCVDEKEIQEGVRAILNHNNKMYIYNGYFD